MIAGSALFSHSAQNGHWRSAKTISIARAPGEPSLLPCCGIPSNSPATADADFTDPVGAAAPVVPVAFLLPPPPARAITTATTATSARPPTANQIRRRLRAMSELWLVIESQ